MIGLYLLSLPWIYTIPESYNKIGLALDTRNLAISSFNSMGRVNFLHSKYSWMVVMALSKLHWLAWRNLREFHLFPNHLKNELKTDAPYSSGKFIDFFANSASNSSSCLYSNSVNFVFLS
jgi:hypothetical protein